MQCQLEQFNDERYSSVSPTFGCNHRVAKQLVGTASCSCAVHYCARLSPTPLSHHRVISRAGYLRRCSTRLARTARSGTAVVQPQPAVPGQPPLCPGAQVGPSLGGPRLPITSQRPHAPPSYLVLTPIAMATAAARST